MTSEPKRLLLIDENVRDAGGHYLELATLLMEGAKRLGYQPTLATNRCFAATDAPAQSNSVLANSVSADGLTNDDLANDDLGPDQFLPCFRSRRMNQWSLGVDGHSQVRRDLDGRPTGRPAIRRLIQSMRDALSRRSRQPKVMVSEWSEDFLHVIHQFKPERGDRILVNTTDDFVMLGLANALQHCRSEHPLQIDVIFHFALYAA
ncbi:MAG: hypothetical protein HKN47_17070, partial [Pirellulaceae bacterium]|nr:hypothetical protein [Pirellulaceae bacterium]